MEIKYEAVFGPQELFDGAPEDAVIAIKRPFISGVRSEKIYFFSTTLEAVAVAGSSFNFNNVILKESEYAERRIIRTPTWTVEDKKAGRLPPIGSRYLAGSNKREFTCLFHGKGNGTTSIVGYTDDGEVTGFHVKYCHPIETPEEKAKRLEDEFYQAVRETCAIETGEEDAFRLACIVAYRMILSGDLPVPVKE